MGRRNAQRTASSVIVALAVLVAGALPVGAAGPEREAFEFTFEEFNPCTGALSTITMVGVDRFHVRETAGKFLFVGHIDATWSTDDADPFIGRYHDTVTVKVEPDGRVVSHVSVHFVGRNGAGQVVVSRWVLQLRVTAEGVEREFVRESSKCVGRR
jgi:hypothetical protein